MNDKKVDPEYLAFLGEAKAHVQNMRMAAATAINCELIHLHWDIGRKICECEGQLGTTEAVLASLARDLQAEFPGAESFTLANLAHIRKFYLEYGCDATLQSLIDSTGGSFATEPMGLVFSAATLVADESDSDLSPTMLAFLAGVSWNHHVIILKEVTDPEARFFYIDNAARYGWSAEELMRNIALRAFERSRS